MRDTPPDAQEPDLLGRVEFAGDLRAAASWLAGKRVLITGAAGSVGSPLAACLSRAGAAERVEQLILLDHHEYSLFELERDVGVCAGRVAYELQDVRDRTCLERVFRHHRPDVIFHLAAAKHVPYGERFPDGVVRTNILATANLLDLAGELDVRTFVYPSSDKSVEPPSLYGASKRVCEALVQQAALRPVLRPWLVTRFVNIIGTRGSVIETFQTQVERGHPLSVTDERMTRFWISMREAVWCLLESGRVAAGGEVFLPECGDAIPVLETARRLAARVRPDMQPYPISVIGARPGERLHEVLLSRNEERAETGSTGLFAVQTRRTPETLASVSGGVEELRRLVQEPDDAMLRATLMKLAQTLQ